MVIDAGEEEDGEEQANTEKETVSSGSINKPGNGGSSGGNIKSETGETVGGQDKQEQDETSENIEDTSEQQEDFAESTIHSV